MGGPLEDSLSVNPCENSSGGVLRRDFPSFRDVSTFFKHKQLQLAPAPDEKLGKMIDFLSFWWLLVNCVWIVES